MFKSFYTNKFKFTHDFVSSFSGFSAQGGSLSIGNYLINYPAYQSIVNNKLEDKYKKLNNISKNNKNLINEYQKELIDSSKWEYLKSADESNKKFNEDDKDNSTSSLNRKYYFSHEHDALEFINIMKEKCDEIDHHPSWTFICNHASKSYCININLSSHFNNNNVSEKDYELAIYLEYEFERYKLLFGKRQVRFYIGLSLTFLLFLYLYNKFLKIYKNKLQADNDVIDQSGTI